MTQHHAWPAWRYGPKGEAAVFGSEADVPKGWHDHPSKHGKSDSAASATETKTRAPSGEKPADKDAHGHPFNPELHAATASKTKDGLWRMKVGVKRPDPMPGYPLDL